MNSFERVGHEQAKFFVGPEVERTPAYSRKTLFVVGPQSIQEIEQYAQEFKINHVFLTANRCFDALELVGDQYMVMGTPASHWDTQAQVLINKGYMVTVDYPAHKHVHALKVFDPSLWASRNFIPLVSVALPHVSNSSQNLTIKIDDVGFGDKGTNPGVWCFNHKELTDNNRFTPWVEYDDDCVITADAPVPLVAQAIAVPAQDVVPVQQVTAPPAQVAPVIEAIVQDVSPVPVQQVTETESSVQVEPVTDTEVTEPTAPAVITEEHQSKKIKGGKK